MNSNVTGIVFLVILCVFALQAFFSWIILYHIRKYSLSPQTARKLAIVFTAGSLVFLSFLIFKGISLIYFLS